MAAEVEVEEVGAEVVVVVVVVEQLVVVVVELVLV